MKEFYFDSISATRMIFYYLFSCFATIGSSIIATKLIGGAIPFFTTLIGVGISLFYLGKKVIRVFYTIKINQNIITVNENDFFFEDIKSYDFDFTGYVETIALRFGHKNFRFNNPNKSNHRDDFLLFKKVLERKIEKLNKERTVATVISQKNFYNSKYAIPFAYL